MRPKVGIITKVVVASLLIIRIIRLILGCDTLGGASESRHNYEGRGSIPVPESCRPTLGATPSRRVPTFGRDTQGVASESRRIVFMGRDGVPPS